MCKADFLQCASLSLLIKISSDKYRGKLNVKAQELTSNLCPVFYLIYPFLKILTDLLYQF